jgi:CRP-like cAMP-binding protein
MDTLRQLFVEKMKLDNDHYEQFIHLSKKVLLPKKEVLIKEGTICSFMGFVESGVLRAILMKDGEEFTSDFFFAGSFVTVYTSFLKRTPAVVTIQANGPTTIHCLSYSQFNHLLETSSEWYKLAKYIADAIGKRLYSKIRLPKDIVCYWIRFQALNNW